MPINEAIEFFESANRIEWWGSVVISLRDGDALGLCRRGLLNEGRGCAADKRDCSTSGVGYNPGGWMRSGDGGDDSVSRCGGLESGSV